MALFTLTINSPSPSLESRNSELALIHQYVDQAVKSARNAGGAVTSGNIMAPGGATVVGSWSYSPSATR